MKLEYYELFTDFDDLIKLLHVTKHYMIGANPCFEIGKDDSSEFYMYLTHWINANDIAIGLCATDKQIALNFHYGADNKRKSRFFISCPECSASFYPNDKEYLYVFNCFLDSCEELRFAPIKTFLEKHHEIK